MASHHPTPAPATGGRPDYRSNSVGSEEMLSLANHCPLVTNLKAILIDTPAIRIAPKSFDRSTSSHSNRNSSGPWNLHENCPVAKIVRAGIFLAALMFALIVGAFSVAARQQSSPNISNAVQQASNTTEPAAQTLAAPQNATEQVDAQHDAHFVTAYTLPSDLYRKAHDLGRIYFWFGLIAFPYGLILFWVILHWKLPAKYRDLAEKMSPRRFVQALIFSPLLILTVAALVSPEDIAEQQLSRSYGLSIQGWGSWAWDWVKGQCVNVMAGTIMISLLYIVIRRSPRRWWLWFWTLSLPVGLFLFFLQPLVVDPMFHKFEPLAQKDPALVTSLQEMSSRAGENIPPEQMFWMNAGEKTTELNAYVTGIGASKRIVVWDTTIAKLTTPQIVFIAGHEMGHYVLNHIPKQLAFEALFLFLLLYIGFRCIGWTLSRWGEKWHIRGVDDWASLPFLLMPLFVLSFLANPIVSAVSRHYEHQADQYGLEVTHELTPDSAQQAAQAFQILGEVDLADPAPNPVNVLLFYSHPPIGDRVRFALAYDPWSNGGAGEFVH
jgi:STE24 endopeptidase